MNRRNRRRQPASLVGFDVKVKRAREHLDAFREADARINRAGEYEFLGEIRSDGREHIYRVHNPPAPDPQWSVIAGDCLHNLRAALDYLAYQLVLVSGNKSNERTQFPIRKSSHGARRGRFRRWLGRKSQPAEISGGVRADILKVVQAVQPYNRGNRIGEQLWMLHQLDVIDKHRQLLLTTVAIPATSWSPSPYFRPEDLRFDYSVRRVSEILEHKKAAFKITSEKPSRSLTPNLRIHVTVSFRKAEAVAGGEYVITILEALCRTLESDIRPLFAPFF